MWTLLVLLLVMVACATGAAKFSIGGRNITLKPLLPIEEQHGRRRLASGNATLKILRSRTEPSRIIMAIAPQTYIVTTQVLMEHNSTAQEYETGAPSTSNPSDSPSTSPTPRPTKAPKAGIKNGMLGRLLVDKNNKTDGDEKNKTKDLTPDKDEKNKTKDLDPDKDEKNKTKKNLVPHALTQVMLKNLLKRPVAAQSVNETDDDDDGEEDAYAPYEPEYKFGWQMFTNRSSPANASTSLDKLNSVIIKSTFDSDVKRFTISPGCTATFVGFGRFRVRCGKAGITMESVQTLAVRTDVLWIVHDPVIKMAGLPQMERIKALLNATLSANESVQSQAFQSARSSYAIHFPSGWSFGTGTGILVVGSDTSLDTNHSAFYDASGTVPFNSISRTMHSKVFGILNADADGYYANTDAHGTAVASVQVGKAWGSRIGVAPGAGYVFIDMSAPGTDALIIPDGFYTTLTTLGDVQNATVHGASWTEYADEGRYTDTAYSFDQVVWNSQCFHQRISCGNSGPDLPCGPGATGKNVNSVGATSYDITCQAYFSSTGMSVDGRRLPLISSPGWNVPCAKSVSGAARGHTDSFLVSGTSLTAIDGVLALLAQRWKTTNATSGCYSAMLGTATLLAHTEPTLYVGSDETCTSKIVGVPLTTYGTPVIYAVNMIDAANAAQLPSTSGVWQACWARDDSTVAFEGMNVALKWKEPGSVVNVYPSRINDLDMVVMSDVQTAWSEDAFNTHEFVRGIQVGKTLRVAVFAYQGQVTYASLLYFAVHVRGVASRMSRVACGSEACLPGYRFECATPAQGYERFCMPNGSLSACMLTEVAGNVSLPCASLPANVVRGYMDPTNTTCFAAECAPFYALNATAHTCACIPGVFSQCSGSANGFVACNATGSYDVCAAAGSKYDGTVVAPYSTSGNEVREGWFSAMRIPAVIVLLIFSIAPYS